MLYFYFAFHFYLPIFRPLIVVLIKSKLHKYLKNVQEQLFSSMMSVSMLGQAQAMCWCSAMFAQCLQGRARDNIGNSAMNSGQPGTGTQAAIGVFMSQVQSWTLVVYFCKLYLDSQTFQSFASIWVCNLLLLASVWIVPICIAIENLLKIGYNYINCP